MTPAILADIAADADLLIFSLAVVSWVLDTMADPAPPRTGTATSPRKPIEPEGLYPSRCIALAWSEAISAKRVLRLRPVAAVVQ
jgi:hypothetical protein